MARCDAIEECNRLLFEAVNESSVSKLQNVTSTHSKDIVLAGFDICNENGENPLVIALKGGNVDLIVELVKTLKYCQNLNYECYPVLLNAFGKLSNQIPITQLIEHLFDEFYDTAWLKFLGQVFIESTSFTRQEKVIALELIGALLNMYLPFPAICAYPAHPSELGLKCWRKAMTLRYFPSDGEPLLPKIPYVGVTSVASSVVFGSAVEVISMEGLDHLEEHFEHDFFSSRRNVGLTCKKQMQRQALLVIRRVTSQSNSEHPSSLYLKSLLKFVIDLVCDLGYSAENQLITNTFLLILEQINGFDPKKIPRKSSDVFIDTLIKMSYYFYKMLEQPPNSPGSRELSYANFLVPTRFFDTIANVFPIVPRKRLSAPVFFFVYLLDSISPRLSSQEQQHLEECYSNYVRVLFPERTTTVLHAAAQQKNCNIGDFGFRVISYLTPTKLILKLGADPNAIDESGQTPLHILARSKNIHLEENVALFQALVDAGTHLDMATDNGDTVLSILKTNLMRTNQSSLIVPPYYESVLNTVFPLSCYCARVIRRSGIRYDEDRLPIHLQEFVSRHSAKDPS